MGLFMLSALHSVIFTALPYKHDGQAALKSTMKVKHSILHVVYLHFKTNKGKSTCVSLISHVFSQKIRFTLLCVAVSSKSVFKINFQRFIFAAFLVVLGHFWLYEEFDDIYPKKPESVTKKDISDYSYQRSYISL